jgi:hypothetical protein
VRAPCGGLAHGRRARGGRQSPLHERGRRRQTSLSAPPFPSPIPLFPLIAGVWGSVLGGTVAYLWSRPIPTQLKIIQVRSEWPHSPPPLVSPPTPLLTIPPRLPSFLPAQGRIVAQASLIFGAAGFALVHFIAPEEDKVSGPASSTWVLRDYAVKPHDDTHHGTKAPAAAPGHKAAELK